MGGAFAVLALGGVVEVILYLIVAACIFGLLWWLINFVAAQVGPGAEPFIKVARVILVIAAVLVAIGILLSLVGQPVVAW